MHLEIDISERALSQLKVEYPGRTVRIVPRLKT